MQLGGLSPECQRRTRTRAERVETLPAASLARTRMRITTGWWRRTARAHRRSALRDGRRTKRTRAAAAAVTLRVFDRLAPTRRTHCVSHDTFATNRRVRRTCWRRATRSVSFGAVVSAVLPGAGGPPGPDPGGTAAPTSRYTGPSSDAAYTRPTPSSPRPLRLET